MHKQHSRVFSYDAFPKPLRDSIDKMIDTSRYEYFCEGVYECQRGIMSSGGSKFDAGLLGPFDPPPWCDPTMTLACPDLTSYPLPTPDWQWVSPHWMIDFEKDVDKDGWEYAGWFGRNASWHSVPQPMRSFVRRRKWLRICRRKIESPTSFSPTRNHSGSFSSTNSVATKVGGDVNHDNGQAGDAAGTQPNPADLQSQDTMVRPQAPEHLGDPDNSEDHEMRQQIPVDLTCKVYRKRSHMRKLKDKIHDVGASVSNRIHRSNTIGGMSSRNRRELSASEMPRLQFEDSSRTSTMTDLEGMPLPFYARNIPRAMSIAYPNNAPQVRQYHSEMPRIREGVSSRSMHENIFPCNDHKDAQRLYEKIQEDPHGDQSQQVPRNSSFRPAIKTNDINFKKPIDIELIKTITPPLLEIIKNLPQDRERLAFIEEALSRNGYPTMAVWYGATEIYNDYLEYGVNRVAFVRLLLLSSKKMSPHMLDLCARQAINGKDTAGRRHTESNGTSHDKALEKITVHNANEAKKRASHSPEPSKSRNMPTANDEAAEKLGEPETPKFLDPSKPTQTAPLPNIKSKMRNKLLAPPTLHRRSNSLNPTSEASCKWSPQAVWKIIIRPLVENDTSIFYSDLKCVILQ
ncbi:hypothetical protein H4219_000458 [Mycoemilia scoparia]|uniref:TECPR1-like DysF domain-containing protein n=1 Tax=Mycoemilia scoparia TaxID=417184 RepID=A0A9W8AAR7_9FUNG|nr:hypothetical protein H4219_000458 [Mycoemilia scoparia]